jgi:hypothetical protein
VTDHKNPFVFGRPVLPERFIGREREVKAILDRLTNPAPGSTAISGERLIGKTSLLHYICSPHIAEKRGPLPEKCISVFIDGQTIVPFTPDGFWRYILKSLIKQQAYNPKHIESLLKEKEVGTFELGELFDCIAQEGKMVVLLLDEFEHIVEHVNPDNPELLNLLRALINRPMHGLALVLASREPLKVLLRDFRFAGSPFPTSFISLSLGPFSLVEANKLIETYTRDTRVSFNREEIDHVYDVSGGHPSKLQKACHEIFEQKTRRRRFQIPIRKPFIRGLSKAFIKTGLVVSTTLLVFALALWYQYIYPETIVDTQITPYGIGYSVGYPEWIGIGDTEQFRVALTNKGTQSLSNVRVYLDFSDTATVSPPPRRSLTADIGKLPVKNTWADKIEFCPEKVKGTDDVQTDLLITSDELGEKLLNTYTFKVIDIPYMEDPRAPKNLIRWFLKGVGALAGAFLTALAVSSAGRIVSSRGGG